MGRCIEKPECGLGRTFAVIAGVPQCVLDNRSDANCMPGETYFAPFDMCATIIYKMVPSNSKVMYKSVPSYSTLIYENGPSNSQFIYKRERFYK